MCPNHLVLSYMVVKSYSHWWYTLIQLHFLHFFFFPSPLSTKLATLAVGGGSHVLHPPPHPSYHTHTSTLMCSAMYQSLTVSSFTLYRLFLNAIPLLQLHFHRCFHDLSWEWIPKYETKLVFWVDEFVLLSNFPAPVLAHCCKENSCSNLSFCIHATLSEYLLSSYIATLS